MRLYPAFTGMMILLLAHVSYAQHHDHTGAGHQRHPTDQPVKLSEVQPLLSQALRLKEALSYLGSPLSTQDEKVLDELSHHSITEEMGKTIQHILDPYCLAYVDINPEGRVKVDRGPAKAQLIHNGWTSFLVKVNNDAGSTPVLQVESPNALLPVHPSSGSHAVHKEHVISRGQAENRFLEARMYTGRPLLSNLTGYKLEYAVVQLYSSQAGQREVEIGFNVGHGSQDIGFRNTTHILFDIRPSVKVKLNVKDHDGQPVMASFTITDNVDRVPGRLGGVYPLPSRRVAEYDEYPDFFFQKQIYRNDGEYVLLPAGRYQVSYTRGPEYIPQVKEVVVPAGKDSMEVAFELKRWINMAKLGWISADHHVHAAGCAHYDSPQEGVPPSAIWRQALGEDLNISALLTWGPSWYHQKKYFTGKDDPLSTDQHILRYDVEVSGFPSSHAGHIVLLGLKEDDYPGTTKVEEWPSWTLPILKWARAQGGIVGYAHSGWGLEPVNPTTKLPNYELPKMDGIGANEYVVTVANDAVDFYSLGNTPALWELNMWYHTLNSGFRTKISGETDFPCITDDRIGLARSYFKSDLPANYENYLEALANGRNYVSEGSTHIMDFSVNGREPGTGNSELKLKRSRDVIVKASVASYLPELADDVSEEERTKGKTYWSVEWSRVGRTRNVLAELIVNGQPVDTVVVRADGRINDIAFTYRVSKSCWAAVRVWGSAHTNPVFITVNDRPIVEKLSAEWCLNALEQCWKMKEPNIRPGEKAAARQAYDFARERYKKLIGSAP